MDAPTTGRAEEKAERLTRETTLGPKLQLAAISFSFTGILLCIIDGDMYCIIHRDNAKITQLFTYLELTVRHSAYMTSFLHFRRPLVYTSNEERTIYSYTYRLLTFIIDSCRAVSLSGAKADFLCDQLADSLVR